MSPSEGQDQKKARRSVGRPTKYTKGLCAQVEAEMAKGYSLTAFAGIIGVDRDTITEWARVHPEFSLSVRRAKAKRLLQWERAAMKVASSGGGPGTATVIVFGLKNMGGGEWADKSEVKNTGALGSYDVAKLAGLSIEELRAFEETLARIASGAAPPLGDPGGDREA